MKIITLGDELLRGKSAIADISSIDKELISFIDGMFETMTIERGVGLAAVQLGRPVRIFVTRATNDKPRVFINPEILETSIEQVVFEEGCLSIPGINADVRRPAAVRIQAWNEKGRPFTIDADELLARVIQHEYDHLNGKLFIDHLDKVLSERLVKSYNNRINVKHNNHQES